MSRRTALVTGGNRGIGRQVCQELLARGLEVILAARDDGEGRRAARELGVRFHRLDVADDASVAGVRTLGDIDVLVNNAGIYSHAAILEAPMDELRRVMQTNAWGAVALCQLLVPGMRARGWGRVVNLSSGMGQTDAMDQSGSAAYRLSKLVLGAATRMVAAEAGPAVKVNACDPGWVRTRMGGAGAPRSIEEGADTVVWLATLPDDGPTGGLYRRRARVPW